MKAKFISKDEKEINRLAKSLDMALFIFELRHNGWRRFKNSDYDYEKAWEVINELLNQYNINIDDLIE